MNHPLDWIGSVKRWRAEGFVACSLAFGLAQLIGPLSLLGDWIWLIEALNAFMTLRVWMWGFGRGRGVLIATGALVIAESSMLFCLEFMINPTVIDWIGGGWNAVYTLAFGCGSLQIGLTALAPVGYVAGAIGLVKGRGALSGRGCLAALTGMGSAMVGLLWFAAIILMGPS